MFKLAVAFVSSVLLSCVVHAGGSSLRLTRPRNVVSQEKAGSFVAPDTKLQAVFDWVKKHGGTGLSNIRIGLFDKGGHKVRGLAASRNLAAGSEVLSIPSDVILTLKHPTLRDSPFQEVKVELQGLFLRLPLYLAAERCKLENGKTSFWAPFINSLPTPAEFASFHPYYAKPGVLKDFSALPLTAKLEHDISRVDQAWKEHSTQWIQLAKKAGADNLTFEDFKWACTCIWTRSYSGLAGSDPMEGGLVPISDLGNHAATATLDWSHDLTGSPPAWKLLAHKDIREGEELTESYGDKDNEVLLWTYGFTLADNPVAVPQLDMDACKKLHSPMVTEISDKSEQPQILRSIQALSREQCAEVVGHHTHASFLKASAHTKIAA